MTDVVFDNGYEADAWREIREWEQRPDARLSQVLRAAGRPVGRAADTVLKLPVLSRGADRLGDTLRAASTSLGGTVGVQQVLAKTEAATGRTITTLDELRKVDLRTLDRQAKGLDKRYIALASASGVPPPMTAPGALMSAPASSSASSAATSSLLAAQCSGVSSCGPWKRALTSAPAATRAASVAAPFG